MVADRIRHRNWAYPRRSCCQHENSPENTPRPRARHKEHCGADLLYKLTGWFVCLVFRDLFAMAVDTKDLFRVAVKSWIIYFATPLFVCLFVWGKTRKSILLSLWLIVRERMEVITPGSGWRRNQPGLELYPRLSCFQHENRPENTPRPLAWHKEHCGADLIRHGPRVRTLWRRIYI